MITEQKFLTETELNTLKRSLESAPQRDRLMILTTMYTGSRSVETLNLTTNDLGERSITIHGVKGSADRTVPILDMDYWFELLTYIDANKVRGKIFPISTRHYRRVFDKYCQTKSLKSLRHTMGVRFYKSSRDIHAVKHVLGHKQINNTMVYMDFVESQEVIKEKMRGIF